MAKRKNPSKVDNPDFSLSFIPFVTPSEEVSNTSSKKDSSFDIGLTGEEASSFYKDVISAPSNNITSKTLQRKVRRTKVIPVQKPPSNCVSQQSVFRFAQDGNLEGLKQYVALGYSIDSQDVFGWTPLMCAACEGHYDCVKYLIQNGANILLKSRDGTTAIDVAKKTNHSTLLDLLRSSEQPSTSHSMKCEGDGQIVKRYNSETKRYCPVCNLHYKSSKSEHESGITHLLNSQKPDHSTFYHIPESNKGFQIMLKNGWDKNKGLGPNLDGRKFPIKTVLKKDRSCIGKNKEVPKVTHFSAHDRSSVKRNKPGAVQPIRERTLKKRERERLNRINNQKEINFRRQFH